MLQAAMLSDMLLTMVNNSMYCSQILIGLFKVMIYDLINFFAFSFHRREKSIKIQAQKQAGREDVI
jgi:hypothetical protein